MSSTCKSNNYSSFNVKITTFNCLNNDPKTLVNITLIINNRVMLTNALRVMVKETKKRKS